MKQLRNYSTIRQRGSIIPQKRAEALDVAIQAIDQVAKLRELRKNLGEKEQVYANESNDTTMYFVGLANAYCTVIALIAEILGSE